MSQAGTVTYRPRLTKVAIRVIKRGYFWSGPGDRGHTVIVR